MAEAAAVAAAVAAASDSSDSSDSSHSSHIKSQQQLPAATSTRTSISTNTISISSSSNRGDAGAVGALLVLEKQMLGPAVAMVVVAVVAGWGRRFASSWPGSCQAACREFCPCFCLRFGFVPERKSRRENETAG